MKKAVQRDIKVSGSTKRITRDEVKNAWVQGKAANLPNTEIAKISGVSVTAIREMNKKYEREIEAQVRANLGQVAVDALQNMIDLAFTAENEHVRFVSTKDLLDRAGFKPKSEVDIKQEVIRRDPKMIEAEARERLGNELAEKLLQLSGPIEDGEWKKD